MTTSGWCSSVPGYDTVFIRGADLVLASLVGGDEMRKHSTECCMRIPIVHVSIGTRDDL